MTLNVLKRGALVIALSLPLGACLQSAEYGKTQCPPGTHWQSLPNQANTQQGYRCAANQ